MEMQCSSSKQRFMVVLASGKGLRLSTDIAKQFLPLSGKPILMRTLEAIARSDEKIKIVLVLLEDYLDYWRLLCDEYGFRIDHDIVIGGQERFFSVQNAIKHIEKQIKNSKQGEDSLDFKDYIIGIHDGVRPFASCELIRECFAVAEQRLSAIAAIKPVETIRISDDILCRNNESSNTSTIDRNKVYLIQTPQCFRADIIIEGYNKQYDKGFTDDASVVEDLVEINLVEGNRENIKITTPFDLHIAEALFENSIKD